MVGGDQQRGALQRALCFGGGGGLFWGRSGRLVSVGVGVDGGFDTRACTCTSRYVRKSNQADAKKARTFKWTSAGSASMRRVTPSTLPARQSTCTSPSRKICSIFCGAFIGGWGVGVVDAVGRMLVVGRLDG